VKLYRPPPIISRGVRDSDKKARDTPERFLDNFIWQGAEYVLLILLYGYFYGEGGARVKGWKKYFSKGGL
jgi:hypothetical protein